MFNLRALWSEHKEDLIHLSLWISLLFWTLVLLFYLLIYGFHEPLSKLLNPARLCKSHRPIDDESVSCLPIGFTVLVAVPAIYNLRQSTRLQAGQGFLFVDPTHSFASFNPCALASFIVLGEPAAAERRFLS
jgi:hypothetical protein